jgi:hypothetical protein
MSNSMAARKRHCFCDECRTTNPAGLNLPKSTWYRHQKALRSTNSSPYALFTCTCDKCKQRNPNGQRVSWSTVNRHRRVAHSGIIPQMSSEEIDVMRIDTEDLLPGGTTGVDSSDTEIEGELRNPIRTGRWNLFENEEVGEDDNTRPDNESEQDHQDDENGYVSENNPIAEIRDYIMAMAEPFDKTTEDTGQNEAFLGIDDDDPDPADLVFIELAMLQSKGISRDIYRSFQAILHRLHVKLPSLRRAASRLHRWTNLTPLLLDCCVNSCMAYTGENAELSSCTLQSCNEPRRLPSGEPRRQFIYFPLSQRLALQYQEAKRARIMKTYRHDLTGSQPNSNARYLRDVFDGSLYRDYHIRDLGLFRDPHDVALHISLDGVQVTNMKNHEVRSISYLGYYRLADVG